MNPKIETCWHFFNSNGASQHREGPIMSRPKQQYLVRNLEVGVRAVKELAEKRCLWRVVWEGVQKYSTGGFS